MSCVQKEFLKTRGIKLCAICGHIIKKSSQASKDHEPPLSRGGKPEDWHWTHVTCNWDKGSLTIPEYKIFCRLAHKAMIFKLEPDESKAYQALKKMRKMKPYERKQNFVKREQRIYRRKLKRDEEAKLKPVVFSEEEFAEIKKNTTRSAGDPGFILRAAI